MCRGLVTTVINKRQICVVTRIGIYVPVYVSNYIVMCLSKCHFIYLALTFSYNWGKKKRVKFSKSKGNKTLTSLLQKRPNNLRNHIENTIYIYRSAKKLQVNVGYWQCRRLLKI